MHMRNVAAPAGLDLTMTGLAERLGELDIAPKDLEAAWAITHRPGMPELNWGQRFLVLARHFEGRPTAWVLALESRLRALEELLSAQGQAPDPRAFEAAAQAGLEPKGDALRFPADTRW